MIIITYLKQQASCCCFIKRKPSKEVIYSDLTNGEMLYFYGIFPYGVAHDKYDGMVQPGNTLAKLKEIFDGTGNGWIQKSLSSEHKKSVGENLNQIWPNYLLFDIKCENGNNEINFDITGYMDNEQKQYAGGSFNFIATLGEKMRLLQQHLPNKVWNDLISSDHFSRVLFFKKEVPGLGEKYIPGLDAISEDGIKMCDDTNTFTIYKDCIASTQEPTETDQLLVKKQLI